MADEYTLESVLAKAMADEDLTYGEVVALLFLAAGQDVFNNTPGVFKGMKPIKER